MELITEKKVNRFDIPVKMGILIALVKIILATVQYQFLLANWTMNAVVLFISVVTGIILLYVTVVMQRKAFGGEIDIKNAFQAVFIAILIFVILTNAYDLIYMKFIDPDMMDTIRDSSISFAQRMGAPQEKLDEMATEFDKQAVEKVDISKSLVSILSQIVIYSIPGIICAAAVAKKKSAQQPQA